MKLKICILALALCNACAVWACFSPAEEPSDYTYYNVAIYHENPQIERPSYVEPNLKAWQSYAGSDIALEDIAQVVYKYTLTDMLQCMHNPKLALCQSNAFAKHIFDGETNYAARLLMMAKQVEVEREVYNDPWYYPASREMHNFKQLQQDIMGMIIEMQQLEKDSKFFVERLMLQYTRVLFAQKQYEACIRLWEDDVQDWPKSSLMREMIKSYVAGAYAQMGQKEVACQYFLELRNYKALADVMFTKERRYADFVRAVYDHQPDCGDIVAEVLQRDLLDIEYELDSALCTAYYEVMQHILRTKRSKDMALWYYTAAFLEEEMGQTQKAVRTIRHAAQYTTSKELQVSVRLMRMYLDAKTKPYDSAYEQQLYADLRWIDGLLKADSTRLKALWAEQEIDAWTIRYGMHWIRGGRFVCYPYAMLRKIVLAEVAPRMNNKVGKAELSMALANYTDNVLLTMLAPKERHYFRNSFFVAMDTMSALRVERYAKRALNPQTELERFLAQGSYLDRDYLYDVVGTLYLRERRYKKAMEVLSGVDVAYQLRLNTKDNLRQDPFELGAVGSAERVVDSKFKFACEMNHLEQICLDERIDVNRRALAMINYAIGMRNSYFQVWGLTQYAQGYYIAPGYKSWLTRERKVEVQRYYDMLVKKALKMFTNDEAKAMAYLRYRNNYTVVTEFPRTAAAEYVRGCCDTYKDYYSILTRQEDYENEY